MPKIKLYTKNVCGKCLWVKSELKEKGLAAEEINMDQDEAARNFIAEQGFMAAPILEVDGELFADTTAIIQKLDELAP